MCFIFKTSSDPRVSVFFVSVNNIFDLNATVQIAFLTKLQQESMISRFHSATSEQRLILLAQLFTRQKKKHNQGLQSGKYKMSHYNNYQNY